LLRSIAFFDSQTGQRVGTSGIDLQAGPWALLLIGGIAVLALTLRRPIFGFAALVLTNPFLLAHPFHGTTLTLPKVALVAVALGLIPHLRRRALAGGPAMWLLFGAQTLFLLSMAASSLHASSHGAALRETLKAAQFAATIAVAYLAYRVDPDERVVRYALSAAAALVSVLALGQEFFGAPEGEIIKGHAIARIAGPLEGPNQLAGYLGVMVPAMLAFAVWRPALRFERVAIALSCLACLLTFSKAGIAALVLAVALLLAVRYLPERRAIGAAMAAVAFAVLFALAGASFAGILHGSAQNVFGSTSDADRFNGGLGVRSDLWHGAYALWRAHPLTGVGPGNFELQIGRYDPGVRTHANSMYFQVLAEQGLMGFVAMLLVVAASIGVFVRRLNQPLALGACIAAVAMAFHQIVDCMWVYPKVGVMWWLLLAIAAASIDLSRAPERVAETAVA
jgi:O-antigen ligase